MCYYARSLFEAGWVLSSEDGETTVTRFSLQIKFYIVYIFCRPTLQDRRFCRRRRLVLLPGPPFDRSPVQATTVMSDAARKEAEQGRHRHACRSRLRNAEPRLVLHSYTVDVQAYSDSGRGVGDGVGTAGSTPSEPHTSWSSCAQLYFSWINGNGVDANAKLDILRRLRAYF